MLILARVRFFRKPLAKHEQANQSAIPPKDRHQAFRRKRPHIAGHLWILRNVPSFSALRNLLKQYFAAVNKTAAFVFYERLFALWHVLHLPLFAILVFAAIIHVLAVHLY